MRRGTHTLCALTIDVTKDRRTRRVTSRNGSRRHARPLPRFKFCRHRGQDAGPRTQDVTSPVLPRCAPTPRSLSGKARLNQPLRLSVGWLSPPGTGNEVHKVVVNSERDPVHQNQTARRFPTAVPRNWIRSGALQGRRRNRIQRLQHPPDQMHAMADGVLDASLHAKPTQHGRAITCRANECDKSSP